MIEHDGRAFQLCDSNGVGFNSRSRVSANAHTFHRGTPKTALGVLTGVASEYLLNVERMIQLLSDKYENKITPEVGIEYVSLSSVVRSY